jgi:hypothetical protein
MNAKRPHSKKIQDEGAFSFLLSFFLVEGASSFYFDQMLVSRLNFEFHASLQVEVKARGSLDQKERKKERKGSLVLNFF